MVRRSHQRVGAAFSLAVDRLRDGEEVLAFIDPAALDRDPGDFSIWLSARLTIGELHRLLLPRCDERCRSERHDPDQFVVLADLALDRTRRRRASWWERWNEALEEEHQTKPMWFAGAPAVPATLRGRRLPTGTRLVRVASTDPYWVHYDRLGQETLFRIASGPHEGGRLVAATFGPSPLLPGLAGALIAPDHSPVRDPQVAVKILAAGWAAVERGLPYEE